MTFTTTDIQELRKKTGAGIMDCKEALQQSNGDIEQAIVNLRKKGLADIQDRNNKAALEGMVGHYIHAGGKIGVIVEVNCETDFVANTDGFKQFTKDLAMHIAAANPKWILREEVPANIIEREKDIIADTIKNKPPQIVEKIISGKLNKFFKEVCLIEQSFVKDPNITINDLLGELAAKVGEKIIIKRFARFVTGET
jgi:elongation factor Ts